MPFGVVSGVDREMGVLDGVMIIEGKGQFWGEFGTSHCSQWGLCCVVVRERCTVPKLLWRGLILSHVVKTFIAHRANEHFHDKLPAVQVIMNSVYFF